MRLVSCVCCILVVLFLLLASSLLFFRIWGVASVHVSVSYVNVVCKLNWPSHCVFLDPWRFRLQCNWNQAFRVLEGCMYNLSVNTRYHVWRFNEWKWETRSQQYTRWSVNQRCFDKRKCTAQPLRLREDFDHDILRSFIESNEVICIVFLSSF